jgi:hypothetical protein
MGFFWARSVREIGIVCPLLSCFFVPAQKAEGQTKSHPHSRDPHLSLFAFHRYASLFSSPASRITRMTRPSAHSISPNGHHVGRSVPSTIDQSLPLALRGGQSQPAMGPWHHSEGGGLFLHEKVTGQRLESCCLTRQNWAEKVVVGLLKNWLQKSETPICLSGVEDLLI